MLKNYFKIALRNIRKNKGFSFLNVIGLSLGMACAVLIMLWVNDEMQYDHFNKNFRNLYQVMENQDYQGKIYTFGAMPGPFAPAVKEEIPEIKYAARSSWNTKMLFTLGDKAIYEEGYNVDPDFLKMFTFPLIQGNLNTVLTDPSRIVVTEKLAKKFFGTTYVLGKTLKINNEKEYIIDGVLQDPPLNSTNKFEWLSSFKVFEEKFQWAKTWRTNGLLTFVQLKENANPVSVNKKFHDFIQHHDTSVIARPFLFSIKDWRLRSNFENGKQTGGGRIEYVRLFSIIALLIIVIACINFMNLATARSADRAREIGVRKVMGAVRGLLLRQFLSESVIVALFAMMLAVLIILGVLGPFNQLVEKQLSFSLSNPIILFGLPAIAIICGLISGSYPAFYLSSFNPISIFRGFKTGKNSKVNLIRKVLVVTQFVVSIVLIISTIIIYKQISHVKSRHLGYDKDNIAYFPMKGKMQEHYQSIYNDLINTGMVENATLSNFTPLEIGASTDDFKWDGKEPSKSVLIGMEWVSPQYVKTMRMQLKSGRDFYQDENHDTGSVIINETLAQMISDKDPIGKLLYQSEKKYEIVGVVKDFLYNNMYGKPDPLVLFCKPANTRYISTRIKKGTDVQKAITTIGAVVSIHDPGYPFEYRFLDAEYDNLFQSEMMIGKLSRLFAILAIFISCLGLFGLAAFTAESRTKEIGIRKVLGASLQHVLFLLSKDFLLLISIAFLIAIPVAWYSMHKWLEDFAYRINISWWIFIAAGVLSLLVALFTISFQAVRAAIANPVKSLRTE